MLSIAASYYGRAFRPLNLITFAACITVWVNPFYLWTDISWYLSFLAFFGVMILAPLIGARLGPRLKDSLIIMVAVESVCAETMTLPYVLHTFGQMSFVGLPSNVLVVTLVPLAMLLGLIAGLAGMLAGAIAGWFNWPAQLLLTYMLDVAHVLASIPGIFVENISLSLAQMLGIYGGIGLFIWLLDGKTKEPEYAKITERNIITIQGANLERTQQVVND
jgi:competence protein ComEC